MRESTDGINARPARRVGQKEKVDITTIITSTQVNDMQLNTLM